VAQGLDADMTAVLQRVAKERQDTGRKISITHAVLRCTALTLREHSLVNGIVSEHGVELWSQVNLGVAVNTAHRRRGAGGAAGGHARPCSARKRRWRRSRTALGPASCRRRPISEARFTVSTLGATGIDWFTPVLNPPQIAILGVGRVAQRVVVADGAIVARPMMTLTLVFDHRAPRWASGRLVPERRRASTGRGRVLIGLCQDDHRRDASSEQVQIRALLDAGVTQAAAGDVAVQPGRPRARTQSAAISELLGRAMDERIALVSRSSGGGAVMAGHGCLA